MKAVISNRIYLNCDAGSELEAKIVKELTYEINRQPVSEFPLIIKNYTRVNQKVLSLPSGRIDLIPEDYEIIDRRITVDAKIPKPTFTPRDNQQEAVDCLKGEGLLNAKVGWGKTIAALQLAYTLQQKTLIICTTTAIRDMWVREVNNFFPFKCGILGSGKAMLDSPIVVANIQTLRNRAASLSKDFGLVVVDEVHRAPAKTFSDTLNLLHARYKMGLSGTLERKDGLHVVLQDYFGKQVFVANKENTVDPEVHLWDLDIELSSNPMIPWANKITNLVNNPAYVNAVIALAAMYAEQGHKVLALSDRTQLLEQAHTATIEYSLLVTGSIAKSSEERAEVFRLLRESYLVSIIWGTQSIFSEGVSENILSAVLLGAPINNMPLLEQICGRVMRKADGKKYPPVVIDIGLKGSTAENHRRNRLDFYVQKGYKIVNKGML